jgi:predicted nucleic acid-binding protein
MSNEPARIYWDSCAYISCIEQTEGREVLLDILKLAQDGKIVLVASTLVIAEVVKLNSSSESAKMQAAKIRDFFENDYIKVRYLDRSTAEKAAEFSREFGIKPPDAVHIATAIAAKCECFHTYDGEKGCRTKLLAFDGKIGDPALSIKRPYVPTQSPQQSLLNLNSPDISE